MLINLLLLFWFICHPTLAAASAVLLTLSYSLVLRPHHAHSLSFDGRIYPFNLFIKIDQKLIFGFPCFSFTALVYEKLRECCEKWNTLYNLLISLYLIYLSVFAPLCFVYWIELIWFKESWNDLQKLFIYAVMCFIEVMFAATFTFAWNAINIEVNRSENIVTFTEI